MIIFSGNQQYGTNAFDRALNLDLSLKNEFGLFVRTDTKLNYSCIAHMLTVLTELRTFKFILN